VLGYTKDGKPLVGAVPTELLHGGLPAGSVYIAAGCGNALLAPFSYDKGLFNLPRQARDTSANVDKTEFNPAVSMGTACQPAAVLARRSQR
jgi:hypothetical protein